MIQSLEEMSMEEGDLGKYTWEGVSEQEALQVKVEISFLIDAFESRGKYKTDELQDLVKTIKNRCFEKGRQKAKQAYEDRLTQALLNGAGPAHRMTAIDHMLPP